MGINIKDPSNNDILLDAPAANTFTVSSSGIERLRVSSSGFVGIGTNNPSSRLEIEHATGHSVQLDHTSSNGYSSVLFSENGTSKGYLAHFGSTDSNGERLQLWNESNSALVFGTNNSEAMRIGTSGNIGVGQLPSNSKFIVSSSSFNPGSTTASFALATSGSYGGAIGLIDNTGISGIYVQDSGQTMHIFVGKTSSDSVMSKIRMTIGQSGRISMPSGTVLEVPISTNTQTSSYTLVLADAGRLVEINSASATTLTIPADASVNFPVGTKIDVLQTGTGQITIAGSGFTPNATPGLKISAQWGAASLVKRGTNSWVVIGNLSA